MNGFSVNGSPFGRSKPGTLPRRSNRSGLRGASPSRPAILACAVLMIFGLISTNPVWAQRPIVSLECSPQSDVPAQLIGPDACLQLIVTGVDESGSRYDLTRQCEFVVTPPGRLEVDPTGLVRPLEDGPGVITARYQTQASTFQVVVDDLAALRPVDFENQVIPIFTKLGCNGGGCHGKASGQNGFKLSLLGFYPEEDFEYLVKEGRGRRIFPAAPEKSLLLTKGTGDVPHGGGVRMPPDSPEYRTLLRWIEQGCPQKIEVPKRVMQIQAIPETATLTPGGTQQLAILATYSDGSQEDVTRMTLFEPNELELAESSVTGLVTAQDLSGEVAVMARYQDQVATFRATIPLAAELVELPDIRSGVDQAVFQKLTTLGIPPSPLCDDATFLRRVTLDLTGQLPTAEQAERFIAETHPEKRERLVDQLLASPEYADLFANKWNMILRNKGRQESERETTYEFYQWIWSGLNDNKPYDQFVRELLTATGDPQWNPPVTWYREVVGVESLAEDTAQLFLGVRIQCARCHHHPYDHWGQEDYYSFAAFFSRIEKKEMGIEHPSGTRDRRLFHQPGIAQLEHPRTRKAIRPAGLGMDSIEISAEQDPRQILADWMTSTENRGFARCLVNRYWKHFLNRGIVEPEDDLRETNPPSNPELLEFLTQSFIDSGYDLKALIRLICLSSTYQLSSEPNGQNARDKQNFSRYYPKRMTAESLYDAFHQVTNSHEDFPGLPSGTRALQLPDASISPYFLRVFGQPQGDSACECERSQSANLAQSLHLLNSQEVHSKISHTNGRAHLLSQQTERPHADRMRELYLWMFAREPDSQELEMALAYLEKHRDQPQGAYEDLVWALVNTKEFLFNH